jgi:hypothetical protein
MTGDETEREKRKQYLKDLLRTRRVMRQHLESVRRPQWFQDIYQDVELRGEAEQELEQEEAEAAAAKRRQQESVVPVDPPSPEPELKEASDEETRVALRIVYARYPDGEGPNLAEVVSLVQDVLKTTGLKKSKQRIQDIAQEKEFEGKRGLPGRRRT